MLARLSLLALLLSTACPGNPDSATVAPAIQQRGELVATGGKLALVLDGKTIELAASAPVPYRIVALGPPAVVTSVNNTLSVQTWALGSAGEISAYSEMLPWIVRPSLVALTNIPADETITSMALLSETGGAWLQRESTDLLSPAVGEPGPLTLLLSAGSEPSLIHPFGRSPVLIAADASISQVLWESRLVTEWPVADVQLFAVGERLALLGLQYDYEAWEMLLVDVSESGNGAVILREKLAGGPAFRAVYPGPVWEPAGTEFSGGSIAVLVSDNEADGWMRWRFDLHAGALEKVPGQPPTGAVEVNPLPSRSGVAPGPETAPFAQGLLPSASGADWRIPALMRGDAVLLVDAPGARWVVPKG